MQRSFREAGQQFRAQESAHHTTHLSEDIDMPTLANAPAEGMASQKATNGSANAKLSMDNINPHVVEAQYAVRGAIVIRAGELEKELASGASLPFKKLVYCNIGNPQQLGQVSDPMSLSTSCVLCIFDFVQLGHVGCYCSCSLTRHLKSSTIFVAETYHVQPSSRSFVRLSRGVLVSMD